MREQKYRAWDGEEMHYNVVPLFGTETEQPAIVEHHYSAGFRIKPVKALLEYIGRKDETAQDVYEEDVVLCSISQTQHYKGVVKFSEGHFFIQTFWYRIDPLGHIKELQRAPLNGISTMRLSISCKIDKVLGNTCENLELLEKGNHEHD